VYNALVVDAGPDQSIPAGSSTTLEGSYTGGSGDVQILWEPESLIMQQGILDPQTMEITQDTTFYLTVTDLIIGDWVVDSVRIEVFVGMEEIITKESIIIYPNPFNLSTTIEFSIPEISIVSLLVYNISGKH